MGLKLDKVSHAYDAHPVVREVSLGVAPGEMVCLLGPSGCGKTTTLRIAAGLEFLQSGTVSLGGEVIAKNGLSLPPEKRGVGFLFQDFALFPHLSVAQNVAFGLDGWSRADVPGRVDEVLTQVGMADRSRSFPHTLSGGQQQRVALARALAPKPRLMLLDEPFSGLDSALRSQVRDQTLHILKNSGVSTLMVTHDSEEAMFMADRIALMRDGAIVQMGTPTDLYCHPVDAFVASFFGDVNRVNGQVGAGGRVDTPLGRLSANQFSAGTKVEILIRPEALKLIRVGDAVTAQGSARVLASRLLGRTSLVHLRIAVAGGEDLHLHARMPGIYLPHDDEQVMVELDIDQTFIFAR